MIAAMFAFSLFGSGVTAQQQLSFAASAGTLVSAGTANGSIRVTTGGNRVAVTVTKKAESNADLAALHVTATAKGGRISLQAVFPHQCSNCSISFEVTVPKGVKLDLESTNGSVNADGISGDATLETTNGSVDATYADASGVRSVNMSSTNGSVGLTLPASARLGRVRLNTQVGSISTGWGLAVSRDYVGGSVDRTVSPNGTAVTLSTTNGSIVLSKS